jgi:glycosyltransferase involved in cell wall biosynthesis
MSAPHVLLLRDPPEERRMSMERYADALGGALRAHTEYAVDELAPHIRSDDDDGPRERPGSYLTRMVRYPVVASAHRADIFHVIDHGYAHAAALLPHDRTVVTAHDLMLLRSERGSTGFKGTLSSRSRFRWSVSYLRSVAHVICVSQTTQEDVIDLVGVSPHRTSVVKHGISEAFHPFPEAQRAQARADFADLGSHLLLNVSTGAPYKNVSGVLRVLHLLRERGIEAGLMRVGRRMNRDESELQRTLGLDAAVRDLGRVSDTRLVELYNAADVLLHPSHWEGFGWPPLEAMACGTPVVASTTPAVREVVGDAGLLADAHRIDVLADHVASILLQPSAADDLVEQGRERAATFTWRRAAAEVAAVYDRVQRTARPV